VATVLFRNVSLVAVTVWKIINENMRILGIVQLHFNMVTGTNKAY